MERPEGPRLWCYGSWLGLVVISTKTWGPRSSPSSSPQTALLSSSSFLSNFWPQTFVIQKWTWFWALIVPKIVWNSKSSKIFIDTWTTSWSFAPPRHLHCSIRAFWKSLKSKFQVLDIAKYSEIVPLACQEVDLWKTFACKIWKWHREPSLLKHFGHVDGEGVGVVHRHPVIEALVG